jgi:hypothetical protein
MHIVNLHVCLAVCICVCMCVCMYVRMFACCTIYVYVRTHMRVFKNLCMLSGLRVHAWTCEPCYFQSDDVYVYIYIYIYIYALSYKVKALLKSPERERERERVCVCVCVCVCYAVEAFCKNIMYVQNCTKTPKSVLHACIDANMHTCMYTHTHTYTHIHTHTFILTDIHTYKSGRLTSRLIHNSERHI